MKMTTEKYTKLALQFIILKRDEAIQKLHSSKKEELLRLRFNLEFADCITALFGQFHRINKRAVFQHEGLFYMLAFNSTIKKSSKTQEIFYLTSIDLENKKFKIVSRECVSKDQAIKLLTRK